MFGRWCIRDDDDALLPNSLLLLFLLGRLVFLSTVQLRLVASY